MSVSSDELADSKVLFPDAPQFSDELVEKCRVNADFRPIFFEWYRFVANLAVTTAYIKFESPIFNKIPRRQYHVLSGSINRVARLMISNANLSHEGVFGEATDIIHRCIFETAARTIWLCLAGGEDGFKRYLAGSVKGDIELRTHILARISERGGSSLAIEDRMLASIARTVDSTEMSEAEIASTPALQDLATMMTAVGWNRLMYVSAQKLGSHNVHGTWTALTTHYLVREAEVFVPNASPRPTQTQHYSFTCLVVLSALKAYAEYVLQPGVERDELANLFSSVSDEIQSTYKKLVGGDQVI